MNESYIDFIKWMCEKAKGFEWHFDTTEKWIVCPNNYQWFIDFKPDIVYASLLLQRAIEGINNEHYGGYKIIQTDFNIMVQNCVNDECYLIINCFEFKFIEQAKESVLRYVYEHEKAE